MQTSKDMVSILTKRLLTTKKKDKKRFETLAKQLHMASLHKEYIARKAKETD